MNPYPLGSIRAKLYEQREKLRSDDGAKAGIAGVGAAALTVAGIIVGAVVSLILLANLFPSYQGAVRDLSTNMSNGSWGHSTADTLSPTFSMLIALGGLFAIVGLGFAAYKLSHK